MGGVGLLVLGAAAFAAGKGVVDFTPRGTQPGLVHDIQSSGNCAGCHSGGALETYYPAVGWQGSMMANSSRDPLFWAALDVANADGEALGLEGIGEFCLRCHTPEGWFGGRVRKDGSGGIVDGANGCRLQGSHDQASLFNNDYAGIGCHTCHRMQAQGPQGQPGIRENADFWLDDQSCPNGANEPCRAGPYSYPIQHFGAPFEPPHPWKFSAFHTQSEHCGSCHNVSSPTVGGQILRTLIDNSGVDTGIAFPIERTYSEWLASDFAGEALFADGAEANGVVHTTSSVAPAQPCQQCHMPNAYDPDPDVHFEAAAGGPNRNGNLPQHHFAGANTWIPQILKGEFPNLNLGTAFDQASQRSLQMLTEQSATLDVTGSRVADALSVNVKVTNLSGHKLPTGYSEGRRMWLEIRVFDASDTLLWSDGVFDPDTGALSSSAQTRIYEVKQGIWDSASSTCKTSDAQGREMFHFALNNCIAKDNRIPPLGFTGGDNPEIAPVGISYPTDPSGAHRLVNFDQASYSIALPEGTPAGVRVEARLQFQVASRDYIEFLRNQAVERGIEDENTMCAGGPGRPFSVGPQDQTRGEYLYSLWSNPSYGRSAPVVMKLATQTF